MHMGLAGGNQPSPQFLPSDALQDFLFSHSDSTAGLPASVCSLLLPRVAVQPFAPQAM